MWLVWGVVPQLDSFFFSLKRSEISLILKSLRKDAKKSSEKLIGSVMDLCVILTLHS